MLLGPVLFCLLQPHEMMPLTLEWGFAPQSVSHGHAQMSASLTSETFLITIQMNHCRELRTL